MSTIPTTLRLVEVNGHQTHFRAHFHAFTSEGMAVLELDDGQLVLRDVRQVTFLDRKQQDTENRILEAHNRRAQEEFKPRLDGPANDT